VHCVPPNGAPDPACDARLLSAAAFAGVLAILAYGEPGRPGVPWVYPLVLPVLPGVGATAAVPVLQRMGVAIDGSS
jgi:hypothetical protein